MENIHNIHKTGVVCVVTKEVATVNPLPFQTQVDPANLMNISESPVDGGHG